LNKESSVHRDGDCFANEIVRKRDWEPLDVDSRRRYIHCIASLKKWNANQMYLTTAHFVKCVECCGNRRLCRWLRRQRDQRCDRNGRRKKQKNHRREKLSWSFKLDRRPETWFVASGYHVDYGKRLILLFSFIPSRAARLDIC